MPTRISDLPEYTTITASAFMPIVDVNELVASKNKKIRIDDLRKYFFTGTTTSSSFTDHTPGFYYFGDNSDGPLNLTGSIATVRTFVSRSFASTQDGPPVVKNFSSLFISRSVVVSPTNRCRGMLIFVDGDATISGSLRMTGRGASAVGADASFTTINPPYLGDYWSAQLFPSASYLSRVFAAGSGGGSGGGTVNGSGNPGVAGGLGRSGGGGGGGGAPSNTGGAGAAGTSFSGGSGGGAGCGNPVGNGSAGTANGGAGGNGVTNSGGGAGNPNGSGGSQTANGTGGLLILIVRGNLRIGPNGSITANGSAGNSAFAIASAGAGGGSGGGIVYIYYGGTLTNNGTVTASGGSAGAPSPFGGGAGAAGGAGTAIISKLNVAFPVAN
jgi:hypothetical protein